MDRYLIIVIVVVCLAVVYAIVRALSGRNRAPRISGDFSKRNVHYRQGVTDSSFDAAGPDSHSQTYRSLGEMPDELRRNVGEALLGKPVEGRTSIDPELAKQDFAKRRSQAAKDDSA
jgi:hypothetical protein